ncbi:MAG: hypothetical protein AWU57_760 [Marinobacter sp. T13-3]|jgi:hypothetical protein|nr:MAG: hypothetical protein AWU57_760 [Marinobacter sp. T13-3]
MMESTKVYSDEYLDYFADRFVDLGLHEQGVALEQYLEDPGLIEVAVLEVRPLLPSQKMVQARLDANRADSVMYKAEQQEAMAW